MDRRALSGFLRIAGLPCLEPPVLDVRLRSRLDDAADRLLEGDAASLSSLEVPRVEFLRWLADRRPVLFHGSSRADLEALEPIRLSRDTTTFGNQQAVYATNDPVWAIYFATLRRGRRFSTRNGSLAPAGGRVYPRWYFFSFNQPGKAGAQFGDGSLYVLPRAGFVSEPPLRGLIDTAQWVSADAARPLVRVDVGAEDFPFRELVVTHREREPMLVTWARAGTRARRQRSARR
jgi:hypothetical protein